MVLSNQPFHGSIYKSLDHNETEWEMAVVAETINFNMAPPNTVWADG